MPSRDKVNPRRLSMTLQRREDDIKACTNSQRKNSHPPQLCPKTYSTYIFCDFLFPNFILVFTFLVAVEFWANVVSKLIIQVGLHLGKRAVSARFGTGRASSQAKPIDWAQRNGSATLLIKREFQHGGFVVSTWMSSLVCFKHFQHDMTAWMCYFWALKN